MLSVRLKRRKKIDVKESYQKKNVDNKKKKKKKQNVS